MGKTNQEIADTLFIGKTTVEIHCKNMIRILNLKGAGELLRYALESKYNFYTYTAPAMVGYVK